jgi:hypothetical protein
MNGGSTRPFPGSPISPTGNPPALLEDSWSLTAPGVEQAEERDPRRPRGVGLFAVELLLPLTPRASTIVAGGKAKRRPRSQAPRQRLALQGQAKRVSWTGEGHIGRPLEDGHQFWTALPGRRWVRGGVRVRGRRFALPPATMVKTSGLENGPCELNAAINWRCWRFERLTVTISRFERFTLFRASRLCRSLPTFEEHYGD